ncbi:DNA-packaging protein, partial [Mesorhizobium sp. M4A.F.Ca.ET.050.02.1.1]|uniref:DNA-packaging protein n=1 Tax=Mesorhizobium sp. M4A.F.Ca.ET.050.02.1.1 TaxID=2496754 RepID=UPI001FDFA317
WKARSSHGRNPIFTTPEHLWQAASEYFEWVEANPLYEAKPFAYKGKVVIKNVAKMRAMTLAGLYIFLDIDRTTWADYCSRKDFSSVTTRVDEIIRAQKFAGAAADLLNANIIARDLGLADKSELTGKDGTPVIVQVLKLSETNADDPTTK